MRREGERMLAPGISDNGTGLAALVGIARAIHVAKIRPQRTILFAANVGEEGEGNLRGMRALIDAYRMKLRAVVVLDGSGTDHVTTKALASRRLEVVITGPGGHSWSDFGMVNPINALVELIKYYFDDLQQEWWPFRIPSMDLNLFYACHARHKAHGQDSS